MPEYYEHRQKPLKCQDCGHEFMGWAEYVVHTVDGQMVRAVFNRADAEVPAMRFTRSHAEAALNASCHIRRGLLELELRD